eukprot:sb/3471282/
MGSAAPDSLIEILYPISPQVEIRYREGSGVSPRKSSRAAPSTTSTNGTLKKSSSRGAMSTTSTTGRVAMSTSSGRHLGGGTSPVVGGSYLSPSASRGSLGSPGGNRSLSDTASSFLNTKLEEGSTPLRAGSLAPGQQVNMDKLVVALQYLGYNPTPEQLETLKGKMTIGPGNKVKYSDFVEAAREVR